MPLPVIGVIAEAVDSLLGIGKELIVDKDKYIEFQYKVLELKNNISSQIITMKTTPKVDAFVKLMYACKDVVIPLFRPLGSVAMSGFAAYMRYRGTPLSPELEIIFGAAFPGWMTSRHLHKQRGIK